MCRHISLYSGKFALASGRSDIKLEEVQNHTAVHIRNLGEAGDFEAERDA